MLTRLIKAITKRPPHIEVREGLIHYHVAIVGANQETMLSSETYSCESNAWRAARTLEALTGWEVKGPK